MIDNGIRNKCSNKLKKKKKQKGESYLYKKQHLCAQIKEVWTDPIFSSPLLMVSFSKQATMDCSRQQVFIKLCPLPLVVTSHSSSSSLTRNTSLTQEIYVHPESNFKVETSKPEDQQLYIQTLKIKDRRLHKLQIVKYLPNLSCVIRYESFTATIK